MKPRGRPRGRRNYLRLPITAAEPRCPRCGSTDRRDHRTACTSYRPGEFEGRPYTHRCTIRCTCANCGARLLLVSHRFDPALAD